MTKSIKRGISMFLALVFVLTLLPAAALAAENAPSTEDEWKAWVEEQLGDNKFVAVLASKLSDGKTVDAVIGTVDNGYNAKLVLPNSANSGSAVIGVGMKNVASLEVEGVKSHAMILRDSEGSDVENLSNLMPTLYGFSGATVNATIIGTDKAEYPVTYTISEAAVENGKTTITATPSEGVSDAWHAMVNETNFDIGTQAADSYIVIANGSWLQIGDKLLQFEADAQGNLKLDNIKDFSELDQTIRNAVELVNAESKPVCFYLAAGTKLAVSSSYAELKVPVTVTSNMNLDGSILETLKTDGVNGGFTALLGLMDDVLKTVDGNRNVEVTIKFGEVKEPTTPSTPGTGGSTGGTTINDNDVPLASVLPFDDVAETDWYYDAVKYVYENDLMAGIDDNTFDPYMDTTRGMIVTILYRLEGSPAVTGASQFADVSTGDYYHDAVVWGTANKVVYGYDETTYAPNKTITREEFAAILYRYAQYKGYDTLAQGALEFYDADDVSEYALTPMVWATANAIINGMGDGNLSPKTGATRAQAATILMGFCENIAK